MKFSFIIAVYNCEKYLHECIDSILNQEFSDYEIVMVDDGSTDNSVQICDDYARKYPQIKVIHTENRGPLAARKTAVENAEGEYIITVDSDDSITQDFLSFFDTALNEYNHPECVFFGCTYMDENMQNEIMRQKNDFEPKLYVGTEAEKLADALLYDKNKNGINFGSLLFSLWSKVVKKDLFYKSICSCRDDLRYGEDLVVTKFIFEYMQQKSILICDYFGYFYRQNSTSLINSVSVSKIKYYAKTVEALEKCFEKEKNKISVFAFRVLTGIFYLIAKQSKTFCEYKKAVQDTKYYKNIYDHAARIKVSKKSIKDSLKILVVNKNLLFASYVYFKYFLQGNEK